MCEHGPRLGRGRVSHADSTAALEARYQQKYGDRIAARKQLVKQARKLGPYGAKERVKSKLRVLLHKHKAFNPDVFEERGQILTGSRKQHKREAREMPGSLR